MIETSVDFRNFIEEDLADLVIEVSYYLFDRIVFLTPVLTGKARASWAMSIDSPRYKDVTKGGDPESPLPPPPNPRLKSAIRRNPTSLVYISNGRPYIEMLENGYSQKAPNGMVQIALEEVQWALQR